MRLADGELRFSASDVANFLACQRLTRLDLRRARGELRAPREFDLGFQDLVRRGEEHEREVLARFRAGGLEVVDLSGRPEATREAIAAGVDVIYQAKLTQGPLLGYPDFLVRAGLLPAPDGEPRPDQRHYEVVDAKLARTAKARAVLQTAFYSQLLAPWQGGVRSRWMHLALGHGEVVPFKVQDFAAYERQVRRRLIGVLGGEAGGEPYPEPVEHCALCRWRELCQRQRRDDDDLSLIAGMPTSQRQALKAAGVPTMRRFAGLAGVPALPRVNASSLERAQLQARLQVASEDSGHVEYELLEPERDGSSGLVLNRGLLALPVPAAGDLFFDIEGARYYSEDNREFGLQYLFGIVDTADVDEAGLPRYVTFWAFDRAGEKRAFEQLIDFITERRRRQPGLHVYHYNHYEPTSVDHLTELHGTRQEAVGRLMGRFGTREDEVDDLFRNGVFVDLYRVVRQGLRAGVESYSIKRLEPLCGYVREVALDQATEALIAFEGALEDGTAPADSGRGVVAGYNEDDCRATLALRDWLEERRSELGSLLGAEVPRPVAVEVAPVTEDPEVARIRAALLAGVSAETPLPPGDRARVLLADLLEWHRREAKPGWWRYFYLRGLSAAELVGEPDALGLLAGGEVVGEVKKSVLRRFTFPPQEHKFSAGEAGYDPLDEKGWTVWAVDDAAGTVDLKIGRDYPGPWPAALIEKTVVPDKDQRARLLKLGQQVVREGLEHPDAAVALLRRLRPACGGPGDSLRVPGETAAAAAARLAPVLRSSYLPIQGPPGTGKTHTAARQVVELVAQRRKVGITAHSHSVICNVIDAVFRCADERGVTLRIGQRADTDNPQQLNQPSQATQPPGAGASALEHILGDRATMPADAGLLLDETWRMHPDLCRYTSEAFYDGKLHGIAGLERQEIVGDDLLAGAGLRVVEVPHEGNTNASAEEAVAVAGLVAQLAGRGWRDRHGAGHVVGTDDVLIVTPYNAQIRAIRNELSASGLDGFRVGTVDKFQGREAPVVIYSMATSSPEDAPRGLEFLYDPHRLNVATSRAKALAIIVASPDLVRAFCRTPQQMAMVNALCRAWEVGRTS